MMIAGALGLYPKVSGQGKVLLGGGEWGNVSSGRECSSLITVLGGKEADPVLGWGAGMLKLSPLCGCAKSKDFIQAHVLNCSDLLLKDVLDGCTAVRLKELVVKGRSLSPLLYPMGVASFCNVAVTWSLQH